ncbi:4-alpha-glucanotransferase [Propionispira raffinosivorans]|uniref:4-alpha-glucanotransferase n=1 Tax=Propionispira raffinosivorans TaxID=86959 RepID=UPI0003694742|nr:4-alpha-glucanotransferase [Propionispira raffinosivorans]
MREQRKIIHNSQHSYYRNPVGAVRAKSSIKLSLDVNMRGNISSIFVRIWQESSGEKLVPMSTVSSGTDCDHYTCEIMVPDKGCLLWYYFVIVTATKSFFYGNNMEHLGGVGQCYDHVPPSFQITVFNIGAKTPDWFKHSVMYQIFPDRFYRRGDKLISKKGAVIHANWEDAPCYYKDVDTKEIVAYDFFGGNLTGIIEKLQYLKELGISVIYLNPIFESPSNHHYDTGDYHKIDPLLGSNEDFTVLCETAKTMGIAIIIDGVFSHTGSDSKYFNRDGNYDSIGAFQSTRSPYYEWYSFHNYPYEYDSWWGFHTLPNVNETIPSYMDFIINQDDSVLKHWIKKGVSGWRLDVVDELPAAFSQRFYQVLKEENPDAVLIGEVWEDASNKISYGSTREYLCGQEMDSAMNYPFRRIVLDFLLDYVDAAQTNRKLLSLQENYPIENFYAMMNLVDSHDVERAITTLGEAPFYEGMPAVNQGKYRMDQEHFQLGLDRLKLAVLWQMTFPGVPCVYYGDEIGMQGFKDPYNRGTYTWGKENKILLDWYKRVIALRNQHVVLQTGKLIPIYDTADVYAYARILEKNQDVFGKAADNEVFIVLLNRSKVHERTVELDVHGIACGSLTEVFHNGELVMVHNGKLTVTIKALTGLVYQMISETEQLPRRAGILLHPTSLPSKYGIGDFGKPAYDFVDFLVGAKQKLWQILPLNPVGYGYSPYQSPSAFAGNPMLISLTQLLDEGLLTAQDVKVPFADVRHCVYFEGVWAFKEKCLHKAHQKFVAAEADGDYQAFCEENKVWLEDYALFMALKKQFKETAWNTWDKDLISRQPETLTKFRKLLHTEISYYQFLQYIFFKQWKKLREYANSKGIEIIGDMPIFIAHDSSDVWANQNLFLLDEAGHPLKVAGVPPDYFSATGQLWGNPHYRWDQMEQDDYLWWRNRFKTLLTMVDIIRVDHFRGFESYWEVDGTATTAIDGKWVQGPGQHFFAILEKYFGKLPIIAEDLGIITEAVENLKDECGFPGMKVLHFELYLNEMERLGFICNQNCVVYTGTHDNNTTVGWAAENIDGKTLEAVADLIGADAKVPMDICDKLIEFAYASNASSVIVPMQDLLRLGSDGRMNKPGTVGTNWQWCAGKADFTLDLSKELTKLCEKYKR